jgi:multidrug efflux pump subunit AcrA (membrane-fusion protein)
MLSVISWRSWIALTGVVVLLGAIIVWGFAGSLSVNVYGQGILISSGGIQTIVATESGQISDIRVGTGDFIEKGEVVARLQQPEILNEIQFTEAQLRSLLAAGAADGQPMVRELREKLDALRDRLSLATRIVSPYSGKVVEVKVKRGEYIPRGAQVVTIEQAGEQLNTLEAVLYVSPDEGKRIHPGMEVKLEAASISKETYGYLLGRVTRVNEFPSTFQGMVNVIGNEDLARTLAGSGAPIEVRVHLIPDPGTESGYKWSSSDGPPVAIQSGTLVRGIITVEKSPPLAKIFPQLK